MYVFEHSYTYVCIYIMGIFGTQKYVYNNFRRDGGQSSLTVWHNDCPRISLKNKSLTNSQGHPKD